MKRDELYKEIYDFTIENKKVMEADIRRLGASCDWSRERFTLDPDIVKEVQKTFIEMYNDGLIYRGKRPVNWCTKHQTSLSDVETVSEERVDPLYYMKYGPFTLATVRPETKFGDTAIAVNPNDTRYKDYIGKEVEIETLIGKAKLSVIADSYVDPEFGTGVVKVTPAHDANDFEMGVRHNLPICEVIDQYGKLNEKAGKYAGLKISEARKQVVEDLKKTGLLERVDEKYTHAVKTCYKCGTTIEPRVMNQWFVKMTPLAERAGKAYKDGKLTFIPEQYGKIFNYWMENTIDWNISRQIVWGIPIPARVCEKCGEGFIDEKKESCEKCGGKLSSDTDTFDTWFSSGQWPLLTLNYPDGADFKNFYPTDVMETGYDLVFKWIPRMVIFGLYKTGEVPFHTIYMNGLVNDAKGKKMSKSKGNVISPIDLIDKYGADALRMGLVYGNAPGNDLSLREDKIKGQKHFANKLWNAARFVISNTEDFSYGEKPAISKKDEEYLSELSLLVSEITKEMDNHQYHIVSEKLYAHFWYQFADVIIEESKTRLKDGSPEEKVSAQYTLLEILKTLLRLLHPFMPFVTEEIWQLLPSGKTLLMTEAWPSVK
jgi:valyl-tRNA synthetase